MSATPSILGLWSGEYGYDAGNGVVDARVTVPFTLRVESASGGEFSGWISDDSPHGVPSQALVAGTVDGLRVSFVKTYRAAHIAGDVTGAPVPLREHVRRRYGGELVGPEPEHNVAYRGLLSPDSLELAGSWRVEPWLILIRTGGGLRRVRSRVMSGQWWARRDATDTGFFPG